MIGSAGNDSAKEALKRKFAVEKEVEAERLRGWFQEDKDEFSDEAFSKFAGLDLKKGEDDDQYDLITVGDGDDRETILAKSFCDPQFLECIRR